MVIQTTDSDFATERLFGWTLYKKCVIIIIIIIIIIIYWTQMNN